MKSLPKNLVEKIETVHQNQYETLSDFVSYAVNTYPELSGEKANVYADDFSYLVSANLVVPLYLMFSRIREQRRKS